MKTVDEDLALKTLLEIRLLEAPRLDQELLEKCFFIQKRFQFNPDQSLPSSYMEELIDKLVDATADENDV